MRFLVVLLLLAGMGGDVWAQSSTITPNGQTVPVIAPQPFVSVAGGYATLSATGSSSRVQLPAGGPNIGITNTGTDVVFVLLGNSSVTATTANGQPVAAGQKMTIAVGTATYLAGISGSGTQVLTIQIGTGYLSMKGGGTIPAPPVQTIFVATPTTQVASVGFDISGTYTGTAPTGVDYNVDGGAFAALSSPTIGAGNWTSTAADVVIASGGTHVVGVREQPHTFVSYTSGTFSVTGGGSCSNSLDFRDGCNSSYLAVVL
jgi:hypothetical protein